MRGGLALLLLGLNFSALGDALPNHAASEQRGRESLGEKVSRTSQQLDLKEASNTDSYTSASAELDPNSGNSRLSNTTYHSEVWDVCEEWVGPMFCDKWRDPFISAHGLEEGNDFSPLEGLIGQEWKQRRNIDQGNQYAIWNIEREGGGNGSNRDEQGKLDRQGIVDMRLIEPVRKKVSELGSQTAVRAISLTYDKDSGRGNVMPNMEVLRLMSGRWTKMLRNRLVSNLGEMRANDKPIEFALGEDKPDCESYLRAMQTEGEELGMEERLQSQASLDPETRNEDLRRRFRLCSQMRQASVKDVNPEVQGDSVRPGDPENERFDKWRTRVNIGAIDSAGVDPNQLPKPSRARLRRNEIANLIAEHEVGGLKIRRQRMMSNAEQMRSYNRNLDSAAIGWKEVAMRSENIVDRSKQVRKEKLQIGGNMSLVRLNGLTKEMRTELRTTSASRMPAASTDPMKSGAPLEDTPAELQIRAMGR